MSEIGAIGGLVSRSEELLPGTSGVTTAIWVWAARVGRLVETFTRQILVDERVDNSEFMILVTLWFHGSPYRATPSELAPEVVLSQSGLVRALQRGEANGTVHKILDPNDARALIIELTGEGRALVERIMSELVRRFDERLGDVDDDHRRRLAHAAFVLATAFGDGVDDLALPSLVPSIDGPPTRAARTTRRALRRPAADAHPR
jgi:DNA-binding MarR family transcriptional regulator